MPRALKLVDDNVQTYHLRQDNLEKYLRTLFGDKEFSVKVIVRSLAAARGERAEVEFVYRDVGSGKTD